MSASLNYLAAYYEGNPQSLDTCCHHRRLFTSNEEAEEFTKRGFGGQIWYSPEGWEKDRWGDYINLSTGKRIVL